MNELSGLYFLPNKEEKEIIIEFVRKIKGNTKEEKAKTEINVSHGTFKIVKGIFKQNNNIKTSKKKMPDLIKRKLMEIVKEGKRVKFEKDIFGVYEVSGDIILVHTIDNMYLINMKYNFELLTRIQYDCNYPLIQLHSGNFLLFEKFNYFTIISKKSLKIINKTKLKDDFKIESDKYINKNIVELYELDSKSILFHFNDLIHIYKSGGKKSFKFDKEIKIGGLKQILLLENNKFVGILKDKICLYSLDDFNVISECSKNTDEYNIFFTCGNDYLIINKEKESIFEWIDLKNMEIVTSLLMVMPGIHLDYYRPKKCFCFPNGKYLVSCYCTFHTSG